MMRIAAGFLAGLILAAPAPAALEGVSHADALSGLREVLAEGSAAAVARLGVRDGFFGDARVRIPLPRSLQRVETALRFAGLQGQADELVLAMNRAAEAAVPEAKALLIKAVREMTVQDARAVLTGGDTAGTEYFRRVTEPDLARRFLPVVRKATRRVGLAQQYNALAGEIARFGLLDADEVSIEHYVTRKALDGLFFMIGEQEKALRRNPAAAASDIVRRVLGTLRR